MTKPDPCRALRPWTEGVASLFDQSDLAFAAKLRGTENLQALREYLAERPSYCGTPDALYARTLLTRVVGALGDLAQHLENALPPDPPSPPPTVRQLCRQLLRVQCDALLAQFSSSAAGRRLPEALLETVRYHQRWVRIDHVERLLPYTWRLWQSWLQGAEIETAEELAALLREPEET